MINYVHSNMLSDNCIVDVILLFRIIMPTGETELCPTRSSSLRVVEATLIAFSSKLYHSGLNEE